MLTRDHKKSQFCTKVTHKKHEQSWTNKDDQKITTFSTNVSSYSIISLNEPTPLTAMHQKLPFKINNLLYLYTFYLCTITLVNSQCHSKHNAVLHTQMLLHKK